MKNKLLRILYLLYYIKEMNWPQYRKFVKFASNSKKKSVLNLSIHSILDTIHYNISPTEYFQFRFYEKNNSEKEKWAGTGFMYEYQLIMNPKNSRHIMDDKREFFKIFTPFFVHQVYTKEDVLKNDFYYEKLKNTPSGKIVLKASDGQCGRLVKIIDTTDLKYDDLKKMFEGKYDMVEEFIIQHSALQMLSPSAVNTVRIYTQLDKNDVVVILGCCLRISVNSHVDNMAAGNLAAPIDIKTGKLSDAGVYSDITKSSETIHPITGVSIIGFQIPYWNQCLDLAIAAAIHDKSNRSIGWDIVVTNKGPGLLEGNHDWCKLVWQLPVKKGMKKTLEVYV